LAARVEDHRRATPRDPCTDVVAADRQICEFPSTAHIRQSASHSGIRLAQRA
jgi:hypothetical protein